MDEREVRLLCSLVLPLAKFCESGTPSLWSLNQVISRQTGLYGFDSFHNFSPGMDYRLWWYHGEQAVSVEKCGTVKKSQYNLMLPLGPSPCQEASAPGTWRSFQAKGMATLLLIFLILNPEFKEFHSCFSYKINILQHKSKRTGVDIPTFNLGEVLKIEFQTNAERNSTNTQQRPQQWILWLALIVNHELRKEQTLQKGCGCVLLSSFRVLYLALALKLQSRKIYRRIGFGNFISTTDRVPKCFSEQVSVKTCFDDGKAEEEVVHAHKPHFMALHCQEFGGKNYEASMSHVDKFVKELLSSDAMKDYNRARVYLDENYKSQEHFTVNFFISRVWFNQK
ncbi:hypothetical protein WISP_09087 [Willisornis vidua]|uniref:Uncharacterized protein n=1 Tax=Willisornis vidua TaxID=1566151 RepID=A0ABQ9DV14_9PASS|nr:hypothetical protein WISP_09087 [Willisornis vidua]